MCQRQRYLLQFSLSEGEITSSNTFSKVKWINRPPFEEKGVKINGGGSDIQVSILAYYKCICIVLEFNYACKVTKYSFVKLRIKILVFHFFKTKIIFVDDGALLLLFSNCCFPSLKGHRMAPLTIKNSFTEYLHHEIWTN